MIVAADVLPDLELSSARREQVSDFLGRVSKISVKKCYLKCDFFNGWVDAVIAPIIFCSILVGNIPGVKDRSGPISNKILQEVDCDCAVAKERGGLTDGAACVVNRAQSKRQSIHPLKFIKSPPLT